MVLRERLVGEAQDAQSIPDGGRGGESALQRKRVDVAAAPLRKQDETAIRAPHLPDLLHGAARVIGRDAALPCCFSSPHATV